MKKYAQAIREESEIKFPRLDVTSKQDTYNMYSREGFTAGVNSKIAAKIREDEAVEFAEWCESQTKYNGYDKSHLYKFYLTIKNKIK